MTEVKTFLLLSRGMQAAEIVYNFALSLNQEAMLLAFDDYQGLLKRYARVPDWQKPVPEELPGFHFLPDNESAQPL